MEITKSNINIQNYSNNLDYFKKKIIDEYLFIYILEFFIYIIKYNNIIEKDINNDDDDDKYHSYYINNFYNIYTDKIINIKTNFLLKII